ncbi:BnaUnng02340D [Brassica napus]|uniref:BnaUnng02340D protein n=1 Tax=Brassica napus TaxID=3708 RepID=A0A078JLE2_BRANA|nr:BnaUnng02340D [Brassica napus]
MENYDIIFRLLRVEETHNDEQSATLVDDMILKTHVLGQGLIFLFVYSSIVGEAALTGIHQWLFSGTLFQNQFLSGFKSIAIIPVGSSGVVQLGSTQKVFAYKNKKNVFQ